MFERTFVMWFWLVTVSAREYQLGFPTRWDSATFRDKGTEVPLLSWDKGTTGQAQNLAKGRDRLGRDEQDFDCLSHPVPWDKTGQSRKGRSKTENEVLKQERMF